MYKYKISLLKEYDQIPVGSEIEINGEVENIWYTDYGVSVLVKLKSKGVTAVCYLDQFDGKIGQNIVIRGYKKEFKESSNPGEFDLKKYYNSTETFLCVEKCKILEQDKEYSEILQFFFEARQNLKYAIVDMCDEEESGVICAMLFGDKQYLDDEIKDLYTMSGIGHILAISGLHISMAGGAVYCFMRKIVRQPAAFLISSLVMLCFCGISGASASTVRAVIMYMFSIFAKVLGRRYDIKNAMSVSLIWLLIDNPLYINNGGFILSYLSVAGIAFVLPLVTDMFSDVLDKKTIGGKVLNSFIVSSTLYIVTLMGVAGLYYEIPVYSIFLNIVLLPLMGLIVISGFLGGVLYYIAKPLGQSVVLLSVVILKLYKTVCEVFSKLPLNTYITGNKSYASIILYYSLLVLIVGMCVYMKKKRMSLKKILGIMAIGITGLLFLVFSRKKYEFTIVVLDVGQGDCIYVEGPDGKNYLIDGGSSDENNIGEYKIEAFLKHRGRDNVSTIIITHPDSDHVSGITELLDSNSVSVEKIVWGACVDTTNENYIEICNKATTYGITMSYVDEGDIIDGEMLDLFVISPMKNIEYTDINAASVVLLGQYEDYRFLLTGDIGQDEEKLLLNGKYRELICNIDLLKIAHHGSKNSNCKMFLEWTNPSLAVISCGKDNSYGHPHNEVIQRLDMIQCDVYRTDEMGGFELENFCDIIIK